MIFSGLPVIPPKIYTPTYTQIFWQSEYLAGRFWTDYRLLLRKVGRFWTSAARAGRGNGAWGRS